MLDILEKLEFQKLAHIIVSMNMRIPDICEEDDIFSSAFIGYKRVNTLESDEIRETDPARKFKLKAEISDTARKITPKLASWIMVYCKQHSLLNELSDELSRITPERSNLEGDVPRQKPSIASPNHSHNTKKREDGSPRKEYLAILSIISQKTTPYQSAKKEDIIDVASEKYAMNQDVTISMLKFLLREGFIESLVSGRYQLTIIGRRFLETDT